VQIIHFKLQNISNFHFAVKFTRVTRIYIYKVLNLLHLSCTDVSKILRILIRSFCYYL